MSYRVTWLWIWFLIGAMTYMVQRAYYGVQGPHPVATSYRDYLYRCWGPLLMRFVVDSGFYWITFSPVALASVLRMMGWEGFASAIAGVTQYGFFALFFGLGVDVAVDFGVTKLPIIKEAWPQMPGPLPAPAIVQTELVETKVTQLATTTTMVPPEDKPEQK